MHPPRNKAIVGENAFSHEAGIHQHGMLQHASTYEIMRPEDVGLIKSKLVMGKHSGRHAFRDRVKELGFDLDDFETNRAFQEFKKLADKKKDVYDGDIESIIMTAGGATSGPWTLKTLEVQTHTDEPATATVSLIGEDGSEVSQSAHGDGPIAAAFQALESATGVAMILRNFELHSASSGEDAQGEVTVTVEIDKQSFRGRGASVDIVEAGCRACLEVINRTLRRRARGDNSSDNSQSAHATI
jgi:2-isopropylmalate synthase